MRIVSKKKDYYDSVQGIAQDRSLTYIRTEKKIDYKGKKYPFLCKPDDSFITICNYTIGFCGKVYPVMILFKSVSLVGQVQITAHNICDVDNFVTANYKDKEIEKYFETPKNKSSMYHLEHYDTNHRGFLKFYEKFEEKQLIYQKFFEEHQCPIFVGCEKDMEVVCNGLLRPLEFYRAFNPYQAFQELSMYLGNIAVPMKPIPEISDKIMSEIKGFDKFSFRKDKRNSK